jgi:hypothetical protein
MTAASHWITGPFKGYWYGVEAVPKDHRLVELHGGFGKRQEAIDHANYLRREFEDYETITVVKIETVGA